MHRSEMTPRSLIATIFFSFALLVASYYYLRRNDGTDKFFSEPLDSHTAHTATATTYYTGSTENLHVDLHAASLENTSKPVDLYEYVPSALTPGLVTESFIGAEELHMSHMSCVGIWRWNKTCLFRNLYRDSKTNPGSNIWLFFAAYDPQTTEKARTDLLQRLGEDARVETNDFLRWEGEIFNLRVRQLVCVHSIRNVRKKNIYRYLVYALSRYNNAG